MPNLSDRVADSLIQRQIQTLRAAEGLSQELVRSLRSAEAEIATILASRDLTRWTQARMRNTLGEIREVLRAFTGEAFATVQRDVTEIAQHITARAASDLDSIIGVKVFENPFNARKALNAFSEQTLFGGSMKKFWSRQSSEMTAAYHSIMKESVLLGETPAELLRRVKADPRITLRPAQIRTAVRTSTMDLANTGRMQMYGENKDLLSGMQWLSTLDSRTSPICRGLDGLMWTFDLEPINHGIRFPGPTAHANCRSTQLPIIRSFADLAGRNKDLASKLDGALSRRTRASMDGQVASDLTYSDWLRTKGDDFALEVLGPVRFKLWKEGTLELRDMLDQSASAISVKQLKALAEINPEAWRQHLKEWQAEQPTEELRGITTYVSGSHEINSFLRGDPKGLSAHALQSAYDNAVTMDLLLSKAPKSVDDLVLFRGAHAAVTEDLAFYSASTEIESGLDYVFSNPGSRLIRVKVPAGTRMLAGNDLERELVLGRGGQFRIGNTVTQQFYDAERKGMVEVEVVDVEWLGNRRTVLENPINAKPNIAGLPRAWREDPYAAHRESLAFIDETVESTAALWGFPRTGEPFTVEFLLEQYRTLYYGEMNRFLRGEGRPSAEVIAWIEALQDAFNGMSEIEAPLRVWRGVRGGMIGFDRHAVGDVIQSEGFFSTSADPDVAARFASRGTVYDIRLPAGARAMAVNSYGTDEFEILLNHGARFRVIGVREARLLGDLTNMVVWELELILP